MGHQMRIKTKGFTLIELLIVVAIIGILAAIAIPNFLSASSKTKYGRAIADTKVMVSQAVLFTNDNPGIYPTVAPGANQLMGTTYMSWARDPFQAAANVCDGTSQAGCYQYTAATATTPVSAHTIGVNGTDNNAAWAGTAAITGDDAGVSSQLGCSVGSGASSYAKC